MSTLEQIQRAMSDVEAAKAQLRESAARLKRLLDEATSPHASKN